MPLGSLFSSESEATQQTAAQSAGFSEIAGPATSVNLNFQGKIGKRATFAPNVTLTDYGALQQARELSQFSLQSVASFLDQAITAVSSSRSQAIEAVSSANRGETENIGLAALKWGALAFGVYALARIFWKG